MIATTLISIEDFVARSRYPREVSLNASHSMLWDAITHPWLGYMLLAKKVLNWLDRIFIRPPDIQIKVQCLWYIKQLHIPFLLATVVVLIVVVLKPPMFQTAICLGGCSLTAMAVIAGAIIHLNPLTIVRAEFFNWNITCIWNSIIRGLSGNGITGLEAKASADLLG